MSQTVSTARTFCIWNEFDWIRLNLLCFALLWLNLVWVEKCLVELTWKDFSHFVTKSRIPATSRGCQRIDSKILREIVTTTHWVMAVTSHPIKSKHHFLVTRLETTGSAPYARNVVRFCHHASLQHPKQDTKQSILMLDWFIRDSFTEVTLLGLTELVATSPIIHKQCRRLLRRVRNNHHKMLVHTIQFVLDRTTRAVITGQSFPIEWQVCNWHANSSCRSIIHLSRERFASRDLEPNLSQTSHFWAYDFHLQTTQKACSF